MMSRVVTILGARPQFVKAAVLSREFRNNSNINEIIIHTGQHFDHNMSKIFFEELEIPSPKYSLNISGGLHGAMTGKMMAAIEQVLEDEKPSNVIVYGDTNSTLAGALTAAKLNIPITHIEAGLRSFNRTMPEEINRVLTDHLSNLLLCPTKTAIQNLEKEGRIENVYNVGDIMFDAKNFAMRFLQNNSKYLDQKFSYLKYSFAILTIHREESSKDLKTFNEKFEFAKRFADENNLKCIFPVHPRLKSIVDSLKKESNVIFTKPFSYYEMHYLLNKASFVLTDSGGLQKEAFFHKVPCITLRSETEWIETIDSGWNRLWTDKDFCKRKSTKEFGQGDAAKKITKILCKYL